MHELGIVTHVVRTVNEVAEENHISHVASVTLKIGEVSGIVTELFTECWDYFKKKNPVLVDAQLIMETIPAITYCQGCGQEYETVTYGRICPHCGSEHTWLKQGNELLIKEIGVEE